MIWLVVGVVIVLGLIVAMMLRQDDSFQIAATELGVKLTRTVPELLPRLDGMVDGVAVKVDVVSSREPQLRYRAFYPALGVALRLERETTISRTLGQLGSGDQQIGAKPFDDSFRVNTSRPDALQAMMTPQLRRRLISLIEQYPQAVVADGDITITGDNLEPPPEAIVTTIRDMVSTARDLVAARPPALETPDVRPAPPPVAPQQTPKPPAPKAPGEPHSPEPAVEAEIEAVSPQPTTAQQPPQDVAPLPPPAIEPTGLPSDFFEDVFGENRLSFEDDDRCEQEFRGLQVSLSGTVKQSSPYSGDDELSPQAGTRAVVTVAQIETDLYGKNDIDAVVFLGNLASTELGRGDVITFTGQLEKVDPFMRNLFVVKGTLT